MWKIRTRDRAVEQNVGRPCGGSRVSIVRTIEAWSTPVSIGGYRAPKVARETGLTTGPRSARFDDGGFAVRAHRHLPEGLCDSHPTHISPQRPKRLDRTATAEPGPQQLKLARGARTQSGAGPNGGRAQGQEGEGEKGMCEARKALRTAGGHGGNAGTGMAWRAADGACRCGLSGANGQSPQAFGSGHCLQSRISHDSFLVGYDWWIALCVVRWCGRDGPRCSGFCISRVSWDCRGLRPVVRHLPDRVGALKSLTRPPLDPPCCFPRPAPSSPAAFPA
jgi:hypothetical protein